jgi:hypothetical protein
MKTILLLCLISTATIMLACNQPEQLNKKNSNVPKALQENSLEEITDFSKREKSDILDNIYNEQLASRPDLKEIENIIKNIKEEQVEAINDFEQFHSKNSEYYNSANYHLNNFSDSVLREKIKAIINESEKNYKAKSSKIASLAAQINQQSLTISDYHEALKAIVTIPVIEKFQNENLPNDSVFRRITKEQKQLTGKMQKKVENRK